MNLEKMVGTMKRSLAKMDQDLEKTLKGNKTAAQRVRTTSIEFAKLAKEFRMLSLRLEKKGRSSCKK